MLIQGMVEMAPTISPLENISIAGHTLLFLLSKKLYQVVGGSHSVIGGSVPHNLGGGHFEVQVPL